MSEQVKQIKPLDHRVAAIWEHEWSDYPDLIKVPMEGGKVISYRREIEQPHPQCLKTLEIIRLMKEHTYGGTKQKPADAGTSNRQKKGLRGHYTTEKEKKNEGTV